MIQAPVIAGNWKLNHGPSETVRFFQDFLPRLEPASAGSVVICPPSLSLAAAVEALAGRSDLLLGVQNVYWEDDGAFTGEISPAMARDAGAALAIVGHSERRQLFGETDEQAARKVRATIDAGLAAVFCVGETIEQRDAGSAFASVEAQFSTVAKLLDDADAPHLVLAYEPVWAIGSGRTATPGDASEMHAFIRDLLRTALPSADFSVPILYGGSVKPENAGELLGAPGVDGLLIGGASLDPAGFAEICRLRG